MSPRELEGDLFDCPACGWTHRPSQKCPKSKPPTGPLQPQAGARGPERSAAELTAGFRRWEAEAQARPTTYTPTERRCPGCAATICQATNWLGATFDVVGDDREPWDEHREHCQAPIVHTLPDLKPPRRAGLPYPDD